MSETTALAIRAPIDLTDQIQELQKKNYNILLPMTTFASQNELFVPRLDIVIPDIGGGDFYKQGSKKIGNSWIDLLAPSGQFLNKIASAANIQWHPDKSGHTVLERDRAVYKAVGAVRQADGQWRVLADEYELDLEVIEEELRMEYKKKAKTEDFQKRMKKDGMDIEDYIMRDLLQKRRHKLALAASGAMNRVIRKALTLRSTYPANMAGNPFAIARFDFQPDYNDPTVRRYASIAAIQAQNDLYGQGSAAIPEDVSPDEIGAASDLMSAGNISNIETFDMETGEIIPPSQEIIDITPEDDDPITCDECGVKIEPTKDKQGNEYAVADLVDLSMGHFNRILCPACYNKAFKAEKKKAGGK